MEDNHPDRDESESWQASSGDERPDFLAAWLQKRHVLVGDSLDTERSAPIPSTESLAEQHAAPTVVMEHVAEAAEHNQPVERAYERRQEIKDDASVPARPGATAIGDILSQSSSASSTARRESASIATHKLLATRHAQTDALYRSAVYTGLIAATVVLVFAIIACVVVS